ncbi:MAG: type II methionyl aminopeptidase [Candidatus Thorarchaeota archaeon]
MAAKPHPSLLKAGRIAARVLSEACTMVSPKTKVISICAHVEKRTLDLGGRPAFPCNVSINEVAAHYTSPKGDPSRIPDFGLVKIDIGVQVDGYIADTARTVDIDGTLEGMVSATDDALDEAIKLIRPGVTVGEISSRIEHVIKDYSLRPVKELTGHSIERFKLHAGKRIPNVKTRDSTTIQAGETIAIEPFATAGSSIADSKNAYIFSNTGRNVTLEGVTEKLRQHLRKRYGPFPFASRWIGTSHKAIDVASELAKLLKAKAITAFPVLVEKKGRPVSQTEHTMFVSDDGPIVTTRLT